MGDRRYWLQAPRWRRRWAENLAADLRKGLVGLKQTLALERRSRDFQVARLRQENERERLTLHDMMQACMMFSLHGTNGGPQDWDMLRFNATATISRQALYYTRAASNVEMIHKHLMATIGELLVKEMIRNSGSLP